MMTFKEFLNKKHLDYQISQGRPVSAKEFSQWLGISPTSYSNWVNSGYKPDISRVNLLADKLGGEVYDILGLVRPKPSITLDQLPVELQVRLREFVSELSGSLEGVNPESDEAKLNMTVVQLMGQHSINALRPYTKMSKDRLQRAYLQASND